MVSNGDRVEQCSQCGVRSVCLASRRGIEMCEQRLRHQALDERYCTSQQLYLHVLCGMAESEVFHSVCNAPAQKYCTTCPHYLEHGNVTCLC